MQPTPRHPSWVRGRTWRCTTRFAWVKSWWTKRSLCRMGSSSMRPVARPIAKPWLDRLVHLMFLFFKCVCPAVWDGGGDDDDGDDDPQWLCCPILRGEKQPIRWCPKAPWLVACTPLAASRQPWGTISFAGWCWEPWEKWWPQIPQLANHGKRRAHDASAASSSSWGRKFKAFVPRHLPRFNTCNCPRSKNRALTMVQLWSGRPPVKPDAGCRCWLHVQNSFGAGSAFTGV